MNKNLLIIFLLLPMFAPAKPLTFVTYHATSQYYPNMSASEIAAIVPYGGKLKLKTEPDVDSTRAKKKLKAENLLSEGDVQFGGTDETKGRLELNNVSGTAKSLEAVDTHVQNLYLYNIEFPNPTHDMKWEFLNVKTSTGTYSATFLTEQKKVNTCTIGYPIKCPEAGCPADSWGDSAGNAYNTQDSYYVADWNRSVPSHYGYYFYQVMQGEIYAYSTDNLTARKNAALAILKNKITSAGTYIDVIDGPQIPHRLTEPVYKNYTFRDYVTIGQDCYGGTSSGCSYGCCCPQCYRWGTPDTQFRTDPQACSTSIGAVLREKSGQTSCGTNLWEKYDTYKGPIPLKDLDWLIQTTMHCEQINYNDSYLSGPNCDEDDSQCEEVLVPKIEPGLISQGKSECNFYFYARSFEYTSCQITGSGCCASKPGSFELEKRISPSERYSDTHMTQIKCAPQKYYVEIKCQ